MIMEVSMPQDLQDVLANWRLRRADVQFQSKSEALISRTVGLMQVLSEGWQLKTGKANDLI